MRAFLCGVSVHNITCCSGTVEVHLAQSLWGLKRARAGWGDASPGSSGLPCCQVWTDSVSRSGVLLCPTLWVMMDAKWCHSYQGGFCTNWGAAGRVAWRLWCFLSGKHPLLGTRTQHCTIRHSRAIPLVPKPLRNQHRLLQTFLSCIQFCSQCSFDWIPSWTSISHSHRATFRFFKVDWSFETKLSSHNSLT